MMTRMKATLYGTLTMLQARAKYHPRVSSCHPHHNPHGLVMASIGEGETEAGVGGAFQNRTASEVGVFNHFASFPSCPGLNCDREQGRKQTDEGEEVSPRASAISVEL